MVATAVANGDLIVQMLKWIALMRKRKCRMMAFGAPFEADAQLVQLEDQELVDAIITGDGDIILLGGNNVQFGFNTRSRGCMRYFRKKFAPFVYQISKGVKQNVDLNSWIKCHRSKAAVAAFSGTDYNLALRGVNLKNGKLQNLVWPFMQIPTVGDQDKYLDQVGQTNQYSRRGSKVCPSIDDVHPMYYVLTEYVRVWFSCRNLQKVLSRIFGPLSICSCTTQYTKSPRSREQRSTKGSTVSSCNHYGPWRSDKRSQQYLALVLTSLPMRKHS